VKRYLTMSEKLLNILKQNKSFYITGGSLFVLPFLVRVILPHLAFLCTFLSFCGVCVIIYGFLSYLQKSKNKTVKITATVAKITAWVLIAVFVVSFIIIEARIISAIETTDRECDYIFVLGCGIRGKNLTRAGVSRADAAIDYLNKNKNCTAILCGGQGNDELISEAEALYNYMIRRGIDKSRLLKEEKSTDTKENITFAKELLPTTDIVVGVVTNDFHLYRSKLILNKAGFDKVYCINGPTPKVPLLRTSMYLREYFSVMLEYLNI